MSHSAPLTPTGSTPYLSRLRPNTTHASLGYLNIIRTSAAAQLDNPSRTTDSAHARRTARACDAVLGGIFVNRLRFRRLQVAVGRENPTRTHCQRHVGSPVGRAFVGELGLWLWLVVVALDESGVVVPALRTWSFPCGCARVQGGGGVAGRDRELGTGDRGWFMRWGSLLGPPTGLWQA